MCLGTELPRWQKQCLKHMLATGLVEINLLISDDPANYAQRSRLQKVKDIAPSRLLFTAYTRTLYKPSSMRPENADELLAGVPAISCVVRKKGKYSQYFSEEDLKTIRSYRLDIILRFGFNIIRGEILKVPTYGVWSFHHDDELKYRGGPPCFWEIYKSDPETGSVLQRLTNKLDGGVVLKKGIFRTKRHSYVKNVDQAYYESAKWPAWVCRDIARGNAAYLNDPPTPTTAPIYRYPTNMQFIRFLFLLGGNIAKALWFRLFVMQKWNVALLDGTMADLLTAPEKLPKKLLRHKNSATFNADCFGAPLPEGGTAVFFEELDYSDEGRGKLLAARMDAAGKELERCAPQGLDITCHASYPYLFHENGDTYLVPETGAAGKVSLYRALAFPKQWVWERDLLKGDAFADATLIWHEGRYWLFYTIHNQQFDGDLHLHLAFCDNLSAPFTPHPGNPVKISARSARPAGTPYADAAGNLIRPAQNFCRTYGGSVMLNKIMKLTPTEFVEEEVKELRPFDAYYKDGLHTISKVTDCRWLIDMKRHVFRPLWPLRKK